LSKSNPVAKQGGGQVGHAPWGAGLGGETAHILQSF